MIQMKTGGNAVKITELEKGTTLDMETRYNNQVLHYEIVIAERFDSSVLVEAVRSEEGKLLDFDSPNLFIDLTLNVDDDKPMMWKNVKVRCVTYKKAVYHQILSDRDGVPFNRRDSVRVYSGAEGKAQIGPHKAGVDVIVKDVSYTGFAIVTDKDVEDSVGSGVRLVFDDERLHLDLRGTVVRKFSLENGKFVYGCAMDNNNLMLQKYVTIRQRQEMKRNNIN